MRDNGVEAGSTIHLEEDRLAAPPREHRGEHFQLEIDADGSLGDPILWAVFHSMRQAPKVSLGQDECLYILSLEKKRLGGMKLNSSVEISLEKRNWEELFLFVPSHSLTSVSFCSLPSLYEGIRYSRYLTCQEKPDYLRLDSDFSSDV